MSSSGTLAIPGVNAGYIMRNKLLRDDLRIQREAILRKIIEAFRTERKSELPAPRLGRG